MHLALKQILAARNRPVLEKLTAGRLLLGFDFDGTLAPIVPRPDRVRMRARTRRLFERLVELYPCAVISGRARADVAQYLGKAKPALVVGNHGMEWGTPSAGSDRLLARVARWKATLERALACEPGIVIENKRFSLSVHYRHAPDPAAAEEQIAQVLGTLKGSRAQGGKCVFNVLPPRAGDKGTAILRAIRELRCEHALFVGDDVTDEDAFEQERTGKVTAVRIGRRRDSAASWYLPGQEAIDELLELLIVMRSPPVARKAQRRSP